MTLLLVLYINPYDERVDDILCKYKDFTLERTYYISKINLCSCPICAFTHLKI